MTLAVAPVEVEFVRTVDEWVCVIKADLSRAVEGIVAAGRDLIAAKADVQHGEWLPMLRQIGISESESKRLRAIAETFSNRPNLDDLPRSVSALYELSRLPAEDIEAGIEDGSIKPGMQIKDAKELVDKRNRKNTPVGDRPDKGDSLLDEAEYLNVIKLGLSRRETVKLSPGGKRLLVELLQDTIKELETQ